MNTLMNQTVTGVLAKKTANEVTKKIESLNFNILDKNSEISGFNSGEVAYVSKEFVDIVEVSQKVSELSNGSFDITIGSVSIKWKENKVPEDINIELVDYKKLGKKDGYITKEEGQMLDFGGVAKGYAVDCAAKIYKKNRVKSALINIGGNVYGYGKTYNVGIKNPIEESLAASVKIKNKAVVTSGSYERYFVEDGKTYHHILDPKTGYPADTDLLSVTVVCDSGIMADALSTAVFVMGFEKGKALIDSLNGIEALFIKTNLEIVSTGDIFLTGDDINGGNIY